MTDERVAFIEAIRDFGRRECGTAERRRAVTQNGTDSHSPEMFSRLAELGWLGATIPEAYGGAGGTVVDGCILLDELEFAAVPVFATSVTLIVAAAVERFGSESQKRRVLEAIVSGRPMSIAMSEPDSGSDVGSLRARARGTQSGWLVDGQKTWITTAHHAEEILVVCRTDQDARKHAGISMFLVPARAPGVEIRPIATMGEREVCDVFLSEVVLPSGALLGEENNGWAQLMAGLNFERLIGAALMLGVARRALDIAIRYVKTRQQFGRAVGSFQAIRHRVADLATEVECARLLTYDVARRAEEAPERLLAREASMAKLKASETARRVTLDAMQMMGGAGYASEFGMEQLVRRALPMTIYGGTSEIQREIIGRSHGL